MMYAKSNTLKTGKHKGKTIESLLKQKTGIAYLKFVYFNSDQYDFTDEVLTTLGISKEQRIKKTNQNTSPVDEKWTKSWLKSINHGHNKYYSKRYRDFI